MLTAKAEAVQRLPLPFASTKDQPADEVFADLLRRAQERPEPKSAERPETPRVARREREDAPRRSDDTAPVAEPETRAAKTHENRPDAPVRAAEAPDAVGTETDRAEDAATAAADLPVTDPAAAAPDAAGTPAAPSAAVATAPAAVPAVPPVAGQVAPAATPAETMEAQQPTMPAAQLVAPAAAPAAQAPEVASPAANAPAAAPAVPAAADPAAPAESFADSIEPSLADRDAEVALRVERSPAAPLAQGLGKLGSGAEVALAAQAIGGTMQEAAPGPERNQQARKPAAPSAQPQAIPAQPGQDAKPSAAQPATAAPAPIAAPASAAPAAAGQVLPKDGGAAEPGIDPLVALPAHGTRSAATAHGQAPAAAPGGAPASPADQVAVQIQRAVSEGASRITVQLKPAELGSIEVQLDFAQDGRVSASVLADRPETLDLLQRDARQLERALQDAGLKTDGGSLSFDLRGGGRQDQGAPQMAQRAAPERGGGEPRPAVAHETTHPAPIVTADGGLDIRV
ncbi:MAG: hypothetical protein BroJett029_39030 [Alphaproteobacteria bacterium]|nr:MAG: hypothetical protein BroJett029_39030 [Alphaproteobacteria bacterium]